MDLMLLRLFQRQVLNQCEFILLAATDLNAALQRSDTTRTFYEVQNLLNAAANVSKALWGQGGTRSQERQELRESISVTDDSPLREVTMRNNFEHFDERLEKWSKTSQRHNSVDFCLMPRSAVAGIDPIDWFRVFDPNTTDLYFWSQSFNLQELINEVQRIFPKLRAEADKPHWETKPSTL